MSFRIFPSLRHAIRSRVLRAAALGLLGLAALPVQALAERISCPLAQIRREVTTPLPEGWWNTPYVNSLVEVRVITVGGRKALQCDYGPAGQIQRYAPEGATCSVVGRAFDCVTATPEPRIVARGRLEIKQTWDADLDRSRVGAGRDADIWFQAESRDHLFITPRNGAQLSLGTSRNRGYSGCSRARYTSSRYSLRDIRVGSFICVKTNEGRISEFRLDDVAGRSPKKLRISFTTWQ